MLPRSGAEVENVEQHLSVSRLLLRFLKMLLQRRISIICLMDVVA